MTTDTRKLTLEIRQWLVHHPLTQDQEMDIHGVPPMLFDLADVDDRLKQLNRQIKSLPLQQQKLLHYLSRDLEPALIIEAMEYSSPELFWLDKALLIKEVDPTARQQDVLQVFAINEALLDEIYSISDIMDAEAEKSKGRKRLRWSLIAVPVILLLLYLFVYPLVFKPDFVAMYEKYRDLYRPDSTAIDTVSYAGGSYYEALLLMDDGNYGESARLLEEVIRTDTTYRAGCRWFLSLLNLRNGDKEACKEQLRAIRNEQPVFYKNTAERLFQQL